MAPRLLGRVTLSPSPFLLSRNFLRSFCLSFFPSPYNIVCILSWIYGTAISLIRAKLCPDRFGSMGGNPGFLDLGLLPVSRLPRRNCNMKAAAGRGLYKTFAKNMLLVSPRHQFRVQFTFRCLPTIKRVTPPYRISGGKRARNIFSSRIMSPPASAIFPEMERLSPIS